MVQRLIVPLALRSLLLSIVVAGIAGISLAPVGLLRGDQTTSATLREMSAGVSWTGNSVASDVFTLNVEISDEYRKLHPGFAVSIRVDWEDPQNDFDLYLKKDGQTIEDSTQGQTDSEEVRVNQPANGIYEIVTQVVAVAPRTGYNGRVRLLPSPLNPPSRAARYQKDPDGKYGLEMFQFAPELQVAADTGGQDLRTDIEIDPFDNIYVASSGSDFTLEEPRVALGKPYVRELPKWAAALGPRLGNLIADRNGTLFGAYTGRSPYEIYLAKCPQPCERAVTRRIFMGGPGMTVNHPSPVVAADQAGGLHVAFSNGSRVFLISSADGGATWKDRVSAIDPADRDAPAATSPWVFAGDSGRVGLTWLSGAGDVFYTFTPDAFTSSPNFSTVQIADARSGRSVPSAAVDPFGNANIAFGQTRVLRQVAGERLFFGPFLTAAGTLQADTGIKHVNFNVRRDFSGSLTYLDDDRRLSLKSTQFVSSMQMEHKIAFSGVGKLQDGSDVTFTVVTSDPKTNSRDFSISISNGYFAAGTLQEMPSLEAKVQKVQPVGIGGFPLLSSISH